MRLNAILNLKIAFPKHILCGSKALSKNGIEGLSLRPLLTDTISFTKKSTRIKPCNLKLNSQNTTKYIDYGESLWGEQKNFRWINPDCNIVTQCRFMDNIRANTMPIIRPSKAMYVSPVGTNAISGTLREPIATDGLLQCAALAVVDKTHNLQTLVHCNPGMSAKENRAILEYILSHSAAQDLEIAIAPGFYTKTENMISYLVDNIKDIMPEAKINFVNFPDSNHTSVILEGGILKCCKKLKSREFVSKNAITIE